MDNNKYWEDVFSRSKGTKAIYDLWLNKYEDIIKDSKNELIVDLGCGEGADSLYLMEKGHNVISCDYSINALSKVKQYAAQAKTMNIDITKKLPFEDNSIKIIIANLSLHYFNNETTKSVIEELDRVLKSDGYIIGRVNSINDVNYGSKEGKEIEKHFYLTPYGYKRFFDKEDLHDYFKCFDIRKCEETSILKYGIEKKAFEFLLQK